MCRIHGTASVVIGRQWNASRKTFLKIVSGFCWLGGQSGNGLFSPAAHYIRPASFLASGVMAKISNKEMLFLVRSIFRTLDLGQSFLWQALGFDVKTVKEK